MILQGKKFLNWIIPLLKLMFEESLMASPHESEGTQLTRYKDQDGYEVSKKEKEICWSSLTIDH